jgi:hypothetical protein
MRSLLVIAGLALTATLSSPASAQTPVAPCVTSSGLPSSTCIPAGTSNPFPVKTSPATGSTGATGATVGTTSALALAAGTRSAVLTLQNVSASAAIACTFAPGTAALNTAGSFQLAAGQLLTLSNTSYIPADAINCIASAAATPLTIYAK